MKPFRKIEDALVAQVEIHEAKLVASLVEQLTELLGGQAPRPDSTDPLGALAEELATPSPLDLADPVIQRLFPDAYPDDPGATADFRRYTQEAQRRRWVDDANLVAADLIDASANELRVPLGHLDAWLRTVNGLRLALAVRLDIQDEQSYQEVAALPEDDPRSYVMDLYDWLGFVLESMLEAA